MADWLGQATAAWERGDRESTIQLSQSAICDNPQDARAYKLLGNGLQASNNLMSAERAYRCGLNLTSNEERLRGELFANLGGVNQRSGNWEQAVEFYGHAIAIAPDLMPVYFNWAKGLEERQDFDGAIAVLEKAATSCPMNGTVWLQLGRLRCEVEDFDGGRRAYEKARQLMLGQAEPLFGLAHVWFYLEDFEQAITTGKQALDIDPTSVVGWTNYGVAHYELGLLDEAERCLERSLALDSSYDDARWALANIWLHRGELERGFEGFEARRSRVLPAPDLPVPEWDGGDLTGKTILVYGQSGLGDMVQFARYLPLLQQRGATVKVAVPKPLVRLLGSMESVEAVERDQGFSCEALGIDCFTTFLSVPRFFTKSTAEIPQPIPYLSATASDWQPTLPEGDLQVGIAWASGKQNTLDGDRDYRNRSCPLVEMAEALTIPGVTLHALQVGPDAAALDSLPENSPVKSWSDSLTDLADTAALMTKLDLVISVDTVVPHLSAALGIPTWILLPYMPNWRWQLNRDDCDWYPQMRLFRQTAPKNWSEVLEPVRRSLIKLQEKKHANRTSFSGRN
ncbi:MAG: tetratricopeptide repeat-containing glycosyltransferase family protein [Cyanobacteria bacterium P01_F01_bin.153]